MTQRFTLHIIVCIFFAALGYWLYLQIGGDGDHSINSIFVAGYWFGFLIFIFFSWFFYWILHRRSTKSWIIAQLIAVLIAVAATGSMLMVSQDHVNKVKEEEALLQKQEEQALQAEEDKADAALLDEELEAEGQ